MKQYKPPALWDAVKFAKRYGLNTLKGDFFIDGNGMVNVPDNLPDNPPVFDLQDSVTVMLETSAKSSMDTMMVLRGIVLTILDQLNQLRALHNLAAITPAQALAAVKAKIDSGV